MKGVSIIEEIKKLKLLVAFVSLSLAVSAAGTERPPAKALPNVVLVTIDTLRADHLSCYGYHLKTTPYIDKVAAEGTRFENAYTTIPQTGPSHISILSSRYPQEHGGRINGVAYNDAARLMFLPQILHKYGYRNAAFISAWPLISRLTHLDRYFDHYDEDLNRTYQVFNSSRYAEDVTPRAISWLKSNSSRPFFLWVHYFDPHSPYQLRNGFTKLPPSGHPKRKTPRQDQSLIRPYDSEIAYTDYYLGKLLGEIDDLGLHDSTLLVIVADHGESLGEHGYVGHGRFLYEGIVRVPLIFRWPGVVKAGNVETGKVSLLDVSPTVVDLAIKRQEPGMHLPVPLGGQSFATALVGPNHCDDRAVRFLTFAGKKGFVPRFLSFLWTSLDDRPLWVGQTTGNRKVIWSPQNESVEVYDLAKDPLERSPRKPKRKSRPYEVETARLQHWYESTNGAAGENKMTEKDVQVLKSLGYLQ